MGIDKRLLEILACPECKGPVEERGQWIVCRSCSLAYPIEGAIPVMLPEQARALEEVESD